MSSANAYEDPVGGPPWPAGPQVSPVGAEQTGPDPVHPGLGAEDLDWKPSGPPSESGAWLDGAPLAAECGVTAVLGHWIVALEVGATAAPVALHRWAYDRVETLLLHPTEARVWARAGRLTLIGHDGYEQRLTVLAPEESAGLALGSRWPVGEPQTRVRRAATAAVRDAGEVLIFPSWIARTARISGERNRIVANLVRRLHAVSPETAVFQGHTFGYVTDRPGQSRPSDHRGPVGREGWPGDL